MFSIDNGRVRLRVVATGDTGGDSIRIISGLNGNETVATSHLNELYDGAAVEVR